MSYGYIAKLDPAAERAHVRYNNRYGTAIAADLCTATAVALKEGAA